MKERQIILFSAPMVDAILDGRKTQTRRMVKEQLLAKFCIKKLSNGKPWPYIKRGLSCSGKSNGYFLECPRGNVGDRLKVTFPESKYTEMTSKYPMDIYLEITNIRVERMRDISEEDAVAEGIYSTLEGFRYHTTEGRAYATAKEAFIDLIKSLCNINQHNPWGWVIEFKRVKERSLSIPQALINAAKVEIFIKQTSAPSESSFFNTASLGASSTFDPDKEQDNKK